jgi:tellurite methyltransferase
MSEQDRPQIPPGGVTLAGLVSLRPAGTVDLRILDLRSEAEYRAGHLPGACSIPTPELDSRTHELPPPWRPLLVASGDPAEARRVAASLRDRGWLQCVPLLDPLTDWSGPWERGRGTRVLWEPTPVVQRWAERIPAGPVIDLGCGSGRNAVYLALRGHAVTALDRLPDALEMARRLAARHGVTLHTAQLDLRRDMPPRFAGSADAETGPGGYSAILMIRLLQRDLFAWAGEALRPGGLFLMETYAQDPTLPGTSRSSRRLGPQEAPRAFDDPAHWTILEYAETADAAGDTVARLVVRREP